MHSAASQIASIQYTVYYILYNPISVCEKQARAVQDLLMEMNVAGANWGRTV